MSHDIFLVRGYTTVIAGLSVLGGAKGADQNYTRVQCDARTKWRPVRASSVRERSPVFRAQS
jgi:hypothetical protein